MRRLKTLLFALPLLAVACLPTTRPPVPPSRPPVVTPPAVERVRIHFTVRPCDAATAPATVSFFGIEKRVDGANFVEFTPEKRHAIGWHPVTAKTPGCRDAVDAVELDGGERLAGTNGFTLRTPALYTPICGALRRAGAELHCPDGKLWDWVGASSFGLVDRLADGKEADAIRELDQWALAGYNLVRVFTTFVYLGDLTPEDGQRHLPRLLDLANERGLYVEAVAVADTAARAYDWKAHARRIFQICALAANCIGQFANEPRHGTQVTELHDMATVDRLAREAAAGLSFPWTAGPAPEDEDLEPTGGSIATRHRDRGREPLNNVRRVREIRMVKDATGFYTIDDEPMGFDEVTTSKTGSPRWNVPAYGFMFGALCGGFGVGCTLHSQTGTASAPWTPLVGAAALEFIAGRQIFPPGTRWRYENACTASAPIAVANFEDQHPTCGKKGTVIRAYSFVSDTAGKVIVLHRTASLEPGEVTAGNGWRIVSTVAARPQVTVLEVVR